MFWYLRAKMEEKVNPYKRERIIHGRLIEFIKDNSKGLTMSELVQGTGFSRKAIEKHLQVLALENEIYMKQFGITKVYYPYKKIKHIECEKLVYNNKTVWFDILEGEYGPYLLIQKKKKINNEWVHEHSITVPLDQAEKFLKTLDKAINSSKTKKLMEERYKEKK
ncbi:MAG: hypothetical protein CL811_12845 [Colwelliaceae bacterium]|nr:hypothetical protein [Colwelliaceae bacterium]|tara:strand:+ start:654 stop:1148 length:495 start_codon:yes stop_codon:yes gene_type:complete